MSLSVSLALLLSGRMARDILLVLVFFLLLASVPRLKFILTWTGILLIVHGLALFGTASGTSSAHTAALFAGILRKLCVVTSAGMFLVSVVSVGNCIKSLEKMRVPWAVVVPWAVCVRFLPTLAHESRIIRDAMRVRGLLSPSRILKRPLETGELFFATLMFRSMNLGEELAYSVSTRAAAGRREKAYYRDRSLGIADLVYALAVLSVATGILTLPWPEVPALARLFESLSS
jgi:energy-coupling factor transport system permease protein